MFYIICVNISLINIINLSKTCKQSYVLIEKDNHFWMMLIKNHFGFKLYHRYVHEIFNNKKNSDYVLYRTDKDNEKFEKSYQRNKSILACITWLLNMLNTQENSDGYLAYTSVIKQKLRPRTKELKMSLRIEEFFEYCFKRNKFLNQENISQISLYKLIYFYIIESRRLSDVDLFGIRLQCTPGHLYCSKKLYPKQEYDLNSSTGRCIRLYTVKSLYLVGIKGKFQSILPGIYEIICRIKLDKNEEYLASYNELCSRQPHLETSVKCYFYASQNMSFNLCSEHFSFDYFHHHRFFILSRKIHR
jgi:hypothetical protein